MRYQLIGKYTELIKNPILGAGPKLVFTQKENFFNDGGTLTCPVDMFFGYPVGPTLCIANDDRLISLTA